MSNQNILIGIDLGTTNSTISINKLGNVEVIKKPGGVECTPSVFGFNKAGNKVVGQKAYESFYKDASEEEASNYVAEIKRLMGTPEKRNFPRVNTEMSPEEISSEILISLKEDVLRKYPDFDTTATVITIPAAFSTLQSEATKDAGLLAGFKHVVLLQEPIAAAISYGFLNIKDENWLVYDLGGGTFDVALISCKDGVLNVLAHNGDNFLGGKNFDWEVVEKIIVPSILQKYEIVNFNRGNEKFKCVFARLKYLAEIAKIELSQVEKTTIEVDGVGSDDNGNEIYLNIDFTKEEFEALIKPLVDTTIKLSKNTLNESGINNTLVEKIILVGGPTQMPYIRKRLENDLSIKVDSSVDPLTVVAKGASIYALSQRIPDKILKERKQETKDERYSLNLNYESLSSDSEESISGIVEGLSDSEEEFFLQFQSDSGFYSGQKIKLRNGKFFETVALEKGKPNVFWIYMFDAGGNTLQIEPDSFTITQGLSVSGAPIPHSIGIAVAKKDISNGFNITEIFEKYFEKGSILPLEKTENFKTARILKKDEDQNPLWIKVGEGESEIPDRNTFICELGIKGSELPYDLPEGTDIEITIKVDESRAVEVVAYIPMIDLTMNARSTYKDENIGVSQLQSELNVQRERFETIESNCVDNEKHEINEAINSVESSVKNADLDEDEKRKSNKKLKDLKVILDKLEQSKEMPQLSKEFNQEIEEAKKFIDDFSDEKEKGDYEEQLSELKKEGEKAISDKDKKLLSRVNEQLKDLKAKVLLSNPQVWVYQFQNIVQGNHNFINKKDAQYFIEKGNKAIEMGDFEELKRCVQNLMLLLPAEEQEIVRGNISGITK